MRLRCADTEGGWHLLSVAADTTYGELPAIVGDGDREVAVLGDGLRQRPQTPVRAECVSLQPRPVVETVSSRPLELRPAMAEERSAAMNVLDGAMLRTDRVAVGGLWVALEEGRVIGAAMLAGDRIDAIAVRRRRRGAGVGSALVEALARSVDRLVVDCGPSVAPFWAQLDFDLETLPDGRRRGNRGRSD
jgi:GNAT superfamily N-acetyltransferase